MLRRWKGEQMVAPSIDRAVFDRDNYTCRYCGWQGSAVWLVADHDVPVSRGGLDHVLNLITACRRCNAQKGDMTGAEYRAWRTLHPREANFGPL
jgi:5-methylcytosine-specific restriction endonuclease McrA